ncbi:lysophospholipid acyltransferase family protein [Desulfitobacterium sp. Sab5]|uniref:lysophospholipid acyltransferase family protein n=1 Tax=Desulfitobacterium nosdiversum TaxID=3375356 RepID=UPI003CF39E06
MLRTILWFSYFWLYVIALQPTLLKVTRLDNIGETTEHDRITAKTARKWALSLLKLAGVTVSVTGQEKIAGQSPVLFVSNHQGNFDIPILLGHIDQPKAFIAKIELLKLPMIRTWMKHMKCVFIDRTNARQSLKVINQAADYLKEGYSMVIFPEGTRSKSRNLGEFKAGSLKLAAKAGVPIVPIAIDGSYKIMEQNGFRIKPAHVKITVFDPIATVGLSKEETAKLPEKVRGIIQQALI